MEIDEQLGGPSVAVFLCLRGPVMDRIPSALAWSSPACVQRKGRFKGSDESEVVFELLPELCADCFERAQPSVFLYFFILICVSGDQSVSQFACLIACLSR